MHKKKVERKMADDFIRSFEQLSQIVHQIACEKGWWKEERNDGEIIALIHSELSEALEALRNGNPPDDKIPQFSGVEAELADVIIRIMDYTYHLEYCVADALIHKVVFNEEREHKHGKEF